MVYFGSYTSFVMALSKVLSRNCDFPIQIGFSVFFMTAVVFYDDSYYLIPIGFIVERYSILYTGFVFDMSVEYPYAFEHVFLLGGKFD